MLARSILLLFRGLIKSKVCSITNANCVIQTLTQLVHTSCSIVVKSNVRGWNGGGEGGLAN